MCAQFTLKADVADLGQNFKLRISEELKTRSWDIRVRGFMKTDLAPVIFANAQGELQLQEMCFSLCPTWSQEFPYKWTTYNARMNRNKSGPKSASKSASKQPSSSTSGVEYIYQVPTWREAFQNAWTCLVPMNAAIESSYFGSEAGNIIQFSQKNNEIFYVAGLYSQWVSQITGEIHDTFTLLTDDPYPFFFSCGHDRSLIVIAEKDISSWLQSRSMTPQQRYQFLRDSRIDLEWQVSLDRHMAKGWEKRKPSQEEIEAIQIWKQSV
jgi:putative SOS response-associated peptidase YedK